MFEQVFAESIIQRAKNKKLINIKLHQLRDYATDKHQKVDDTPSGGGPGMVLKVDVIDKAITSVKSEKQKAKNNCRTILLTPKGKRFTQKKAIELSKYDNLILVCGHYEGFDQRVHDHLVDEEISIGDYVLTGGEVPAMVLIDAITRMVPGVIKKESVESESFMTSTPLCHSGLDPESHNNISNKHKKILKQVQDDNLSTYDHPNYTRPIEYKGWKVPEVLLSGNHKKIEEWRKSNNR